MLAEEKPPTWFMMTTVFLLFVSGAWTVASTFPFPLRAYSITAVTVANLNFLFAAVVSCGPYPRQSERGVEETHGLLLWFRNNLSDGVHRLLRRFCHQRPSIWGQLLPIDLRKQNHGITLLARGVGFAHQSTGNT